MLKGVNKKVIGLMKYEIGGKIMTKFVRLGAKKYSYLSDESSKYKKRKKTQKGMSWKENLNLKIIKTA